MPLRAECPRCPAPLASPGAGEAAVAWSCPDHGPTLPLRRPDEASYDGFVELLASAGELPTYLPWPMSPGWTVSDFAVVGRGEQDARATMTCCTGASALDGPVDVFVVSEEAGTGLGSRCAGTAELDPGSD